MTDKNYWQNHDGNWFHALYSNKMFDISCACNKAIAGSDFEIMVFHTDGEPVDGYNESTTVRCNLENLGDELNSLMQLYDDPGQEWYRKK